MSRATVPSNVYVQSSGPCVVCDGDGQRSSQDYSTIHPACLSRIISSGHNSSSPTPNLIDGVLCTNSNQIRSPANFPADNFPKPTCYDCGDNQATALPNSEFWICASCQQSKDLQQYSGGIQNLEGAICDTCLSNQQGFSAYDNDLSVTSYDSSSQPFYNPTNNSQTIPLFDAQNLTNQHQPNNTSPLILDPTPPKRKQTRRYKKTTLKTTYEADAIESEPVIQWVPRRDPLPPNVCSRCRCRYARPGKKQCQHCAYDYRGTRDHRASQGLCITCAEPLDRDLDYVGQQLGYENAVDGTALAPMGEPRPRRSCYACREKNRLKKAAEKAAKSG